MLRALSAAVVAVAALGMTALPAAAATASHPKVHSFSAPAVTGIRTWGSYYSSGGEVHVTLCVKETSSKVDLAVAVAVAFNRTGSKHQQIGVQLLGTGKQACRSMTTKDTAHLYVAATSGTSDGHAHVGKAKRVY